MRAFFGGEGGRGVNDKRVLNIVVPSWMISGITQVGTFVNRTSFTFVQTKT